MTGINIQKHWYLGPRASRFSQLEFLKPLVGQTGQLRIWESIHVVVFLVDSQRRRCLSQKTALTVLCEGTWRIHMPKTSVWNTPQLDFDDTNLHHVMFMPVTAPSSYCQAKCSKVAETLCNALTWKKKKKPCIANFKESPTLQKRLHGSVTNLQSHAKDWTDSAAVYSRYKHPCQRHWGVRCRERERR